MPELGLLRLIEVFAARLEIAAGVDHVAVEPELIEGVGQVVVIGNRFGVSGLVMGFTHRRLRMCVAQCLTDLVTDADHLFKRPVQIQLSLDISAA